MANEKFRDLFQQLDKLISPKIPQAETVCVRDKRKARKSRKKKIGSKKISILNLLSTTSSCPAAAAQAAKANLSFPSNHSHTHTHIHLQHILSQIHTQRPNTSSEIRSINIYAYHCIFNITYTRCSPSLSRSLALSTVYRSCCLHYATRLTTKKHKNTLTTRWTTKTNSINFRKFVLDTANRQSIIANR